jgi:hypothetical protein
VPEDGLRVEAVVLMPKIIKQFRKNELDGKPIMDFVPRIDRPHEQWILEAWMAHFKCRGIPFYVTEEKIQTRQTVITRKTMWTEELA